MVADALRLQHDTQRWQRELAGEKWRDWPSADLVFTTATGRPVEPRNFARFFAAACDAASIRRVRLHTLRHTCASLLKRAGVPARDAQRILGHSRIAVTLEVYTGSTDDEIREALTKLGAMLGVVDDS